jgi:hypothetical protein
MLKQRSHVESRSAVKNIPVYQIVNSDNCISNIDNTSHKEETSNNRLKTKASTAHSSITTTLMD